MTAVILGVILAALAYLAAGLQYQLPLTRWLERVPAPRMPRLFTSSGARNDTPARPRHAPAGTGDAPEAPASSCIKLNAGEGRRTSGDPRAAGATSPRGAQPSGRRAALRRPRIVKRGTHHADRLRISLATTDTLPRLKVDGAPPWNSAPLPVLREGES